MNHVNEIKFRNAKISDFDEIYSLEKKAYKAGDYDNPEHIKYRIQYANPYFLVFVNTKKQIIGYINSIITCEKDYNKNLLNKNNPTGTTLCIHSFVLDINYRGNGLGKKIFNFYITYMQYLFPQIKLIILISKKELAENFYNKFGFYIHKLVYNDWYEMKKYLKSYNQI